MDSRFRGNDANVFFCHERIRYFIVLISKRSQETAVTLVLRHSRESGNLFNATKKSIDF